MQRAFLLMSYLEPLHIPVERNPRNAEASRNLRLALALKPCPSDNSAFSSELVPAWLPSFRSAELLSLFQSPCKSRFCSLAYQIPLDFRRKSERERKHLRLDIVAKLVALLDCPHLNALFKERLQHIQNHHQRASEPRDFRYNDYVSLLRFFYQIPQLPLLWSFCSAHGLLNKDDVPQPVEFAVPPYLQFLIFKRLLASAHADIAINHFITSLIYSLYLIFSKYFYSE